MLNWSGRILGNILYILLLEPLFRLFDFGVPTQEDN